jgi:hypothetical protein
MLAPGRLGKMSRLEHFQQIVEQAKAKANKLRLANLPIEDWWKEIRETIISPVLADAEKVLSGSDFPAVLIQKNGGSGIILRAGNNDGATRRDITFELSEMVVIVSCTGDRIENWDRDHVTEENVITRVDKFLESFVNPAGSISRYEIEGEGVLAL